MSGQGSFVDVFVYTINMNTRISQHTTTTKEGPPISHEAEAVGSLTCCAHISSIHSLGFNSLRAFSAWYIFLLYSLLSPEAHPYLLTPSQILVLLFLVTQWVQFVLLIYSQVWSRPLEYGWPMKGHTQEGTWLSSAIRKQWAACTCALPSSHPSSVLECWLACADRHSCCKSMSPIMFRRPVLFWSSPVLWLSRPFLPIFHNGP